MMQDVCPERSFFRDMEFSLHHRTWGFDAPMVDIDWIVIEFNYSEPVALISYKKEGAPEEKKHNRQAFCNLARRARVPAFQVTYNPDFTKYEVLPLTKLADACWHHKEKIVSELEYVRWLYELSNRVVPTEITNKIMQRTTNLTINFGEY